MRIATAILALVLAAPGEDLAALRAAFDGALARTGTKASFAFPVTR